MCYSDPSSSQVTQHCDKSSPLDVHHKPVKKYPPKLQSASPLLQHELVGCVFIRNHAQKTLLNVADFAFFLIQFELYCIPVPCAKLKRVLQLAAGATTVQIQQAAI